MISSSTMLIAMYGTTARNIWAMEVAEKLKMQERRENRRQLCIAKVVGAAQELHSGFPAHQRNLADGWGVKLNLVLHEHAFTDAAEDFKVGTVIRPAHLVRRSIEIIACLKKWESWVVHRVADRYSRIHVEQKARDGLHPDGIEKIAELRQCNPLEVRENELFVGIDGQRPVPVTERIEQFVCPRGSVVALGVALFVEKT